MKHPERELAGVKSQARVFQTVNQKRYQKSTISIRNNASLSWIHLCSVPAESKDQDGGKAKGRVQGDAHRRKLPARW